MTDELGRQTLYAIDPANGNRLSVTQVIGAVGGGDDLVTSYTYTARGMVATITDPSVELPTINMIRLIAWFG